MLNEGVELVVIVLAKEIDFRVGQYMVASVVEYLAPGVQEQ